MRRATRRGGGVCNTHRAPQAENSRASALASEAVKVAQMFVRVATYGVRRGARDAQRTVTLLLSEGLEGVPRLAALLECFGARGGLALGLGLLRGLRVGLRLSIAVVGRRSLRRREEGVGPVGREAVVGVRESVRLELVVKGVARRGAIERSPRAGPSRERSGWPRRLRTPRAVPHAPPRRARRPLRRVGARPRTARRDRAPVVRRVSGQRPHNVDLAQNGFPAPLVASVGKSPASAVAALRANTDMMAALESLQVRVIGRPPLRLTTARDPRFARSPS